MTQIPPSIIGTIAPILDAQYTHSQLNALFMHAGFPGDSPDGNKTQKCLMWLRRGNAECAPIIMCRGCAGPLGIRRVADQSLLAKEPCG